MQALSELEVRAFAKAKDWKFIRVSALPLGGYWKAPDGACFYVRQNVPVKEEKRK
jgi:hypothetical protein